MQTSKMRCSGSRGRCLGKLLFLVLAVAIVWMVIKNHRKSALRKQRPQGAAPEDMVRCDHCGIHLPRMKGI